MLAWLLPVSVGGALGACTRYAIGRVVRAPGRDVLVANVAGSLLLGFLTGAGVGGRAGLALGVGFCGALTTFSSFGVHTVEEGGSEYALGTLAAALLAVVVGTALGAWLAG